MRIVYQSLQVYHEDFELQVLLLMTYENTDRSVRVQDYCDRWAARENRPLKVIPNTAQNANMDNPDAFNRILDEFRGSISN